jgi:hypothetical protein
MLKITHLENRHVRLKYIINEFVLLKMCVLLIAVNFVYYSASFNASLVGFEISCLFSLPLVILRDSHPDDAEYMEQMKQLPGPKSCFELLLKVKYYITLCVVSESETRLFFLLFLNYFDL